MKTIVIVVQVMFMFAAATAIAGEPVTLTFEQPETAGISGFRNFWDLPVVTAGDGVVGTKGNHVGSETGPYTGRQAVWIARRHPAARAAQGQALCNRLRPTPAEALVTEFPLNVSSIQRITIKDGVSYIGVVPLPATDLGRDAEVVINPYVPTPDRPEGNMQGVTISNYMLKRDEPLDKDTDWKKVQQAYGGFAIEMSDNTEYRISPIFSSTLPEPHSKRDGKKTPV